MTKKKEQKKKKTKREILHEEQILALKDTIKVWELIASIKSRKLSRPSIFWRFKMNMCKEALNIEDDLEYGCPLCEKFVMTNNCPLGPCQTGENACEEDFSYGAWRNSPHQITKAKKFLEELKEVLRELEE